MGEGPVPPLEPSSVDATSPHNTKRPSTQDGQATSGLLGLLTGNPFFAGGAGLAALGTTVAITQRGLRHTAGLIKRRLLVDVEINVKDETYPWFLQWMTAHQKRQNGPVSTGGGAISRHLEDPWWSRGLMRRFQPRMHHLSIKTDIVTRPNGSVATQFSLLPGLGKHLLLYRSALIMVDRVRESKAFDIAKGRPWETITLTTLYSHRQKLEDLFAEAHDMAQRSAEGRTVIYISRSTTWEAFGEPQRKRPFESVILGEGVKERILTDVEDFLASEEWYHGRGIPYRRGYLLHGSPGSGKSSFVRALAAQLNYNIAVLNLSERGLTDDRLQHLLSVVPKRTLVLLEDVDAAFGNRRVQTDSDGYHGANVTFSGLLNALDGVSSGEERLMFLTTNHVERLDAALVRPGRVDMTIKMGAASAWQAGKLWDRFYAESDPEGKFKEQFLRRLIDLQLVAWSDDEMRDGATISMAALQGLFLYNKSSMEGAIQMADQLGSQLSPGNEQVKVDTTVKNET